MYAVTRGWVPVNRAEPFTSQSPTWNGCALSELRGNGEAPRRLPLCSIGVLDGYMKRPQAPRTDRTRVETQLNACLLSIAQASSWYPSKQGVCTLFALLSSTQVWSHSSWSSIQVWTTAWTTSFKSRYMPRRKRKASRRSFSR